MDRTLDNPAPLPLAHPRALSLPPVGIAYTVEGLCSIGGNLMQVGIFFYTSRRFGWGLKENFTLAAVQGIVYVIGALLAHGISTRLGPRRALATVCAGVGAMALGPLVFDSETGLVASVLAYTAIIGLCWPILESMVSAGVDAHAMSRRISVYNVVWAGTGAATLAVNGAIIDYWPAGVFLITAIVHGVAAGLLLLGAEGRGSRGAWEHGGEGAADRDPPFSGASAPTPPCSSAPPPPAPEPELLRVRTLALWLSRISMPASYALIYALSALLPSLPPIKELPTWAATLVGSTWLMARWFTFIGLGVNNWWHTRPRVLLVAAWLMLAAFVGATWQPAGNTGGSNALAINLAWLVVCQVVIGLAIGLIYSASLYFGMVLSEGSTEHSGYHEALIGLGSVLGPGAGAVAQWAKPGDLMFGVFAVAGVLLASTLMANGASVVAQRRQAGS